MKSIKYLNLKIYNENYYLPLPYNMKQIQLNKIGYLGFTGKRVKLAILDSGVDTRHSDLKISSSFSVFDYGIDKNPNTDLLGHGTHIAGIIAAKENEVGITGIAPDTEIFSGKIIDHNDKTDAIKLLKGIDWAIKNKVDIINLSLYITEDNKAVKEILDFAYHKKNITIVAAAGNFGNIMGKGDTVTFPARYDSVISVASNDVNGERSSFSSTGPKIDITAPGSDIISTYPPNNYRKMSGTSMATPHVSAAAALLKEKNPNISASDIRRTLIKSSYSANKNNNFYGHGFLRLENSLTFDGT
ncbi:S8 family peptidase [Staphylococcus aureus]|uniref:S8 family peptidase n=2 Tax=Staphylococcus aureus TaxID=1280 RepID=UPI0018EBB900|nr:S8 family peptidase [Staphylococcus aureus]MBJ6131161.1 S8 family peptidase [Staphylococcus aureus]MBJ6141737.1 S8 family peptidase [Staphylococcus aureus]MBJ6153429.1 S8 family peptidase [Staphylococcus aureus]MBJ6296136.1 S8 family peptidase [Staphylococcus aureus]MBJ6350860.1 S8 family peptidase [Staphylococcus aureus]